MGTLLVMRAILAHTVLVLALTLVPGCRAHQRTTLFVGDSNTHFLPCAYPLLLQARHPVGEWRMVDAGIFGSTARRWLEDDELRSRLEASNPTEVVIALGTNDIGHRFPFPRVLQDLLQLKAQAEAFVLPDGTHPKVYVATVPRLYPVPGTSAADVAMRQRQVDALNALLRTSLPPPQLVDFDSWMPRTWTDGIMWSSIGRIDGVHLGCEGHKIRADVIEATL